MLQETIDTTSPGGRLVFHVFAELAEFERDLVKERTNSGLAAARARGRIGGRPSRLSADQVRTASAADPHGTGRDITVAQLRGADHLPTLGGVADPVAITDDYERVMSDWLQDRLTLLGRGSAS